MLDGPSARVLVYLEVAEQAGLSLAPLTEGLLDGGALEARVPFAAMMCLLNRMAYLLGGGPALEEACARFAYPPDLAYLANSFDSQREFSRFVCDRITPVNFPFAQTTHRDLSGGEYRETVTFPAGAEVGTAGGHATVGFVRGQARLRGLPENRVRVTALDERRVTFVVTPPDELRVRLVSIARRDGSTAAALRALVADRSSFTRQRGRFELAVETMTGDVLAMAPLDEYLSGATEVIRDLLESDHCAIWATAAGGPPPAPPRLLAWAGRPPPWPASVRLAIHPGFELDVSSGTPLSLARPLLSWLARRLRSVQLGGVGRPEQMATAWGLTRRQREVLSFLVAGLGNRDIADRLGCTVGTVEQHVSAVFVRSRLSSRTDVLRACLDAQSDTDLPGP